MCHFLRDNLEMRDFKQGVLVGGQEEEEEEIGRAHV